jgi:hypothetical protein
LRVFLGISIMVLAIAIAVIPYFNTCQYNGKAIELPNGKTVAMKCNWSAQAEIAVAAPLFVVGAMLTFARRKESRLFLAGLGALLGIMTLLIPTRLIGVCSSQMPCNLVMKPSLIGIGTLVIVLSLVSFVFALKTKD